jgi:cell division protein FtsI/penicillin-binding protein 2
MSDYSPMMRRVLRDGIKNKNFLPRRGRIRIFLLIILVITLFWLMFSGIIPSNKTNPPILKKTEVNKKAKKKKEKKNDAKAVVNAAKSEKKSEFGYSEVSSLLSEMPITPSSPCDTLKNSKKNLIVYYSLDSSLQKLGTSLMKQYKPLYGAIVALNPDNGRVLSLISWNHDSVPSLGDNLYCKSYFPAASIFKTITAAAAIELAGFSSESTIPHTGRNHTLYKYQLEKELSIYKDVSLEFAYANSMNPVFARIGMYSLNKNSLIDIGKRFGFNTTVPFEIPCEISSLSPTDSNFTMAELASGFNQKTTLSPLLGALIASAVSERGQIPCPHIIDSISNGDSIVYKAQKKLWKTPIKEQTAKELSNMMQCVSRYGTARKSFRYLKSSARFDSVEYGGKTGSVDKDSTGRVDWFIGFARHPKDRRQRIAVGILTVHGAYWTVHSSYIAAEYFRKYLRDIQLEDEKALKMVASSSDSTINSQ